MSHPLKRANSTPRWPSCTGTSQYPGTSPVSQVALYYDPSLGEPGVQNASGLLADADRVDAANNVLFGVVGEPVSVIVFALGGATDGSVGAAGLCGFRRQDGSHRPESGQYGLRHGVPALAAEPGLRAFQDRARDGDARGCGDLRAALREPDRRRRD